SDVVTAVSDSLKKDTLELFDIKNEIEVIPNFIDTKKYAHDYTDCQRSLMAQDHERIVTHISNFRKVKRIADVVAIFHKIQERIPAKLVMVGEGPEREKAEIQCEALGITDKVLFLGNSNEIDRILCFSDLFLLPSESESFGLAALEAMVNEVPVISSNTGGIPEVNIHGQTGFLSPVGAVDEMAENALAILQDPEVLAQFKKRAVQAAQKFDITNILPLYEAVYEKAFASRKTMSL
ncbi:MAG: N-acetyl-alpha-D-glucosaminyl L-malate synthase BshA, partial [Flavobacteriaceae bacterium]